MRLMAPMQAIARQWGPSVVVERSESKACLLEFKTAELEYANPDRKLHGSLRVGDLISCRSCPKRCRKQPLCPCALCRRRVPVRDPCVAICCCTMLQSVVVLCFNASAALQLLQRWAALWLLPARAMCVPCARISR
jgi:hypothetical protein